MSGLDWNNWLKKYEELINYEHHPDNTDLKVEDIRALIDLALQSKDQAWFKELTHRLAVME